ncbi:hypothetical protein GH714_030040 [Hevea brasiliensis]|uniref:Uncharacterized protein n=1 Tax=Hevea brasiliensis TaxID=3981 RepID=A0A6A6K9G7_HEVBR|nr:hypothetical protein GH714_030040 [Hevea brasiliensis]
MMMMKPIGVWEFKIPQRSWWFIFQLQMDVVRAQWCELDQKGTGPGARSSHAITLVGHKAYAFGSEFTLESLSITAFTSSISRPRHVPSPKSPATFVRGVGVTMASVGKTIYVFGGRDATHEELNELYSFDTFTNKWTLLSCGDSGPPHRSCHSTTSDDRRVYIFGGCVSGRLNDLWAYDVVEEKWVQCPTAGENCKGRGGPGLAIAQGKIWVVYGFAGLEVDDVHCFDPANGSGSK